MPAVAAGYCRRCDRDHELGAGNARAHAHELMEEFGRLQRLDYQATEADADPLLSFAHLFPGKPGNMFGLLECRDRDGQTVVLRAFSSLRRGIRAIPGWVPPLLSADTYYGLIVPEQQAIEAMTAELATLSDEPERRQALSERRKLRSQRLFETMRARYRFHNFRGETGTLREVFTGGAGIPGGVGECCAPKLLVHAARNALRPVGLAEFYWGGSKGSKTLRQGEFYLPCNSRCRPILGFLLCGLDDDDLGARP